MKRIKENSVSRKLELLEMTFWGTREICEYFAVSRNKAFQIKSKTGVKLSPFNCELVNVDSLLNTVIDSCRLKEAQVLTALKSENK